jgi:hypothetical protein
MSSNTCPICLLLLLSALLDPSQIGLDIYRWSLQNILKISHCSHFQFPFTIIHKRFWIHKSSSKLFLNSGSSQQQICIFLAQVKSISKWLSFGSNWEPYLLEKAVELLPWTALESPEREICVPSRLALISQEQQTLNFSLSRNEQGNDLRLLTVSKVQPSSKLAIWRPEEFGFMNWAFSVMCLAESDAEGCGPRFEPCLARAWLQAREKRNCERKSLRDWYFNRFFLNKALVQSPYFCWRLRPERPASRESTCHNSVDRHENWIFCSFMYE